MPVSLFDATTDFGQRALQRLQTDVVIWLTTIDAAGTPQSFPVWFLWQHEEEVILIYTTPGTHRLRHLARNARAGAHFNTDADGENVIVFGGYAEVDTEAPAVADNPEYLTKYKDGIVTYGMPIPELSATFSVPIRFIPEQISGH